MVSGAGPAPFRRGLSRSVGSEDSDEHVILLLIGSSHAPWDARCITSLQDFLDFSVRSLFRQLIGESWRNIVCGHCQTSIYAKER